jgi:pantetheine-phosphate adenylyltransferase
MTKTAIYPGSFDPPTNGHLDLVSRALTIFDELIIVVITNPSKKALFTPEERTEMLSSIYGDNERIKILQYEGLLVDFAREYKVDAVLRGLRAVSDFEYEFQMALMNRQLDPSINTVYLMPSSEFSYLSSSLIKEVFSYGGDVGDLIPEIVSEYLDKKFKSLKK